MEKEITKLATTLGVSSESLASVAITLAQAGLSAEETRVALVALAKTELAPSFDNITDTTEGAIAALRQFGLQASELEGVLSSINAVSKAFAVESKDIIAAIPQPNQGYVYLDWTKSQTLLERQLPILQLVEIVGKPLFQNLRSLTISSYGHEEGLLKGGVLFRFLD